MGVVVSCGLGDQAEKLDLTDAQKRDKRFYPDDAVIVFNQKFREAQAGAQGKLAHVLDSCVLVEVNDRYVTVSNRYLNHFTVCQPRALPVADGDRLHLKANRRLSDDKRVTNGELVTVKTVKADGKIELTDGRVLDESYREFLPGYAVTSYGSQGKTVDYVLFSDSTIKAATNAQQWYVTISRGRRGVRIFTPDKEQLRENVTRPGHRPLAMELNNQQTSDHGEVRHDWIYRCMLRFGRRAAEMFERIQQVRRHQRIMKRIHEHKNIRKLGV
jgi:hypothetical protein